ncbi:SusC/RagA family TonB-linked outer membrane protein [Fibrella forsythiae]|uniref:TonB-dependent receptor n=1 Tax=Fibrella forsythiae TaxID=2817061 RepID=A0ABS3JEM5_9BACT|nr:TonB-dependent receptor [Fibrella forsythiae]MBO0947893.1 TonB-dependent receptor [Fibrella forsythiae]
MKHLHALTISLLGLVQLSYSTVAFSQTLASTQTDLARQSSTSRFLQPSALSQVAVDKVVKGTIKDENGQGLPGVSVVIKNAGRGTTTDPSGTFQLTVPDEGSVLVFSFVGYVAQEVPVGASTELAITLLEDNKQLSEVVVIGYGTQRKRDLTGSVVSIKGDETTKIPVTTPVEALQGKIPGADITRASGYAGASASIRIRGNRSIANPGSSNNVLYIVDGVQGVSAADINPNDIQSIDVLKDASSTAIYGSRGANGVIIITTKRGTSGKPKLSYNTYAGISNVAGYGAFMTGPEYIAFRREAYRAAGTWNSPADDAKIFNAPQLDAIQKNQFPVWPDLLLKPGFQQDHQLGITGGTDKTKVYFSAGYYNEKGIIRLDEFKRYSARLNIDQTINNWVTVGIQTQLAYIDNDIRRDPFNRASNIPPLGTPYDENGNFIPFPLGGTIINPLADEQPGAYKRNTKTNRGTLSTYIELTPFAGFSVRSTLGAIFATSEAGSYYGRNTIDGAGSRSQASITSNQSRNLSWENVFTYKRAIQDHSFTVTGVTSYLSFNNTSSFAGGNNQLIPAQYFYNLAAANQNPFYGSGYSSNRLISFTGRINYTWKDKYLLTVTGRTDGSSKLGEGNKWAFFPSAGLGWRISDEPFFKNQKVVSDLKLRTSYGISGNDVINPYATQSSLTTASFSYNDANAANAYLINQTIGNQNLKWELTTTADVGLDIGLLNNRITANIDYYDARTNDLIFPYTLPLLTGVTTVNRNIGVTRNRGIEVGITTQNINRKGFTWSTNLTFARNKEMIVSLPNGNVIADDYRNSLIEGQPSQIYYDYKKLGIWQLGEESAAARYSSIPGDIKIADLNNDGKIDGQDRTIIGSRVPQWTGGLSNDIRFKGFDLNILLVARVGQWISSDYYAKYNRNGNNNGASIDYWTPENPTNEYPRPNANRASTYVTTLTERQASFTKIRNITLGYTLPKTVMNKLKIDNLRVYVSGKNLHTFSSLKDFDPEGEGVIDQPLTRLYVVGLNLGF